MTAISQSHTAASVISLSIRRTMTGSNPYSLQRHTRLDTGWARVRVLADCRWYAYIAGAVLVLMHECGAQLLGDLSVLVSSAVPEGKGVSSSAALEVATMSALAAALDIKLEGWQLAQLCQKVMVWFVSVCAHGSFAAITQWWTRDLYMKRKTASGAALLSAG